MRFLKFILSASIIGVLLLAQSCNIDMNWPGVCESKMVTNEGTYYYCETSEQVPCEASNIGTHIYSSSSCKSLGYTVKGDGEVPWKSDDLYFISPDGAYTPGESGNFVNSGSGPCDMADYNGPIFNTQIDAQCRTAFLYDCQGMYSERDVACDLYYSYDDGSPDFPDCPYCN